MGSKVEKVEEIFSRNEASGTELVVRQVSDSIVLLLYNMVKGNSVSHRNEKTARGTSQL